jgi:TRAP-type C4-dicarboxylate transport system permease small subunit
MKIKNFLVMAVVIISIVVGTRYWDMNLPNLQAGLWGDEWSFSLLPHLPWWGFILIIFGCIAYMAQIEILEQNIKQKEKEMQDEKE